MKEFLRVKIKSLAAESKIIRHEEKIAYDNRATRRRIAKALRRGLNSEARAYHTNKNLYDALYWHRKKVVRPEARAAQLAYGFIRGRAYKTIEEKTYIGDYELLDLTKRVTELVNKYGFETIDKDKISDWMKA
jgi:hypothetical protein